MTEKADNPTQEYTYCQCANPAPRHSGVHPCSCVKCGDVIWVITPHTLKTNGLRDWQGINASITWSEWRGQPGSMVLNSAKYPVIWITQGSIAPGLTLHRLLLKKWYTHTPGRNHLKEGIAWYNLASELNSIQTGVGVYLFGLVWNTTTLNILIPVPVKEDLWTA